MMNRLLHIWIFFLIVLNAMDTQAQDRSRHSLGFIYGQGSQTLLDVQYNYHIQLYQLQYGYALVNKEKWSTDLLIQPQFNFTEYRHVNNMPLVSNGYEYGVNIGLALKRYFFDGLLSYYVAISFGPHYISGAPERQTSGFIFSDNVYLGMTARLDKNIYFELRPAFRHISNANLVKPNRGINNMILNGGFYFYLN
ncbi:MAG: acyloxyacyl hydrolase [Crocinitomicaceae bacterium]|nr:acyloxyacyl hydrolase [Crocinitomicaceae bacterium]